MARPAITFDLGWKRYKRALTPSSYTPLFKRYVGRATARNGKVAEKQIRKEIKGGVPPTNAALTASLKGGSRPIIGTAGADMWNAITSQATSWHTAIAGVKRTVSRGGKEYNVAKIVHEGATVRVTPAMRTMFLVLSWASQRWHAGKPIGVNLEGRARELWDMSKSKRFYALKAGTKVIRIPGRPFVRYAFQDPSLKRTVEANWRQAVNRVMRAQAKGGR